MSRSTTRPAAFAAAYGGKAAQTHEDAPWPYHPIAIDNPVVGGAVRCGLYWGVVDLRKGAGTDALVGTAPDKRGIWCGDGAAEAATQLAYDLHELSQTITDEDFLADYIADTGKYVIVRP